MTVDFKAQSRFFKKNKIEHNPEAMKSLLTRIVTRSDVEREEGLGDNDSIIRLVTKNSDFEERAIKVETSSPSSAMNDLVDFITRAGKEKPTEIPGTKDMWIAGSTSEVDTNMMFVRLFEHPDPVELVKNIRQDMNYKHQFGPGSTLIFCNWGDILKSTTH